MYRPCQGWRRTVLGIAAAVAAWCGLGLSTAHAAASARSSGAKVVYLTFDDGPSERYTPRILDVLRREHARATFFVLGYRCEEFPALVRRMRREGHQIGSHGYDHRYPNGQPEMVRTSVELADRVILRVSGVWPAFYRPPGGILDTKEERVVRSLGHTVVRWTVDSQDWKATDAQSIVRNVERSVRPGAVVLFHDGVSGSRYTVTALPVIIEQLRSEGYMFGTLPVPRHASRK